MQSWKYFTLFVFLFSKLYAAEPMPLLDSVTVGDLSIEVSKPPQGLSVDRELGLLHVNAIDGQVVHRTETRILETRATIAPNGDYLLMFPEGDHYAKSKGEKINSMMACRSTDHGKTWSAPVVAYDIPYGQHGFIPLIPKGSKRIHAFGTQPVPGKWTWKDGKRENAPIGWRTSDDNGHTWSEVNLIEPVNDPGFMGMSVMRMTETDAGTWLLGSHLADWSVKPFTTQQYLLRSEDKGKTWEVLPGARPNGWVADGFDRMDEGRPLSLGDGRVLFKSRTPQGHLFTAWSEDDGKTWTEPAPSSLVHPDAPPMLFPLSDGKTLVAFHHNKVPRTGAGDLSDKAENMKVRSEVWAALSTDGGHTWSEPRFVLANAVAPLHKISAFNSQCSYIDAFTEDGVMHLFMPHRWQQVLHLTIHEDALATLPTEAELAQKLERETVADFTIENSTVLTSEGIYRWSQSRPAIIPGDPARVIVTTQEIEKHGAHGFRNIFFTETTNGGATWSEAKRIESLDRARGDDGIERVMGDMCPQWHAATGTLLVTGKCFGFLLNPNDNKAKDDRSQERVAYAVYSPEVDQWTGMKIMDMPETDHEGKPIIEPNAGCHQRVDLPNGEILLPVRYRKDPKKRVYTSVVARCRYDGKTLTYLEHGTEHDISIPRGLYEPSVCEFQGRYFLTMRAEENGHVTRGTDGIHFEPTIEWTFDDGEPLGSYNTQQHWITHGDRLYLTYTRRGANNDHVFRHRAPIFIAEVDPEKLHVIRSTERVLFEETGVGLGGGFAPVDVSENETWVISTEMSFPEERRDENSRVLLARILWN